MYHSRVAYLFLSLNLFFLTSLFAKQQVILKGVQKEPILTLDYSKISKVTVLEEYIVPEGKTLVLLGGGKLRQNENFTAHLRVGGTLIMGQPKDIKSPPRDKLQTIHMYARLDVETIHENAKVIVRGLHLKNATFNGKKGHFNMKFSYIENLKLRTSGANIDILGCHLIGIDWTNLDHPSTLMEKLRIERCVVSKGKHASLDIGFLWCMKRCDIRDQPFRLSNPNWTNIPPVPRSLYFFDHKYPKFLNSVFKPNLKDFKLKPLRNPNNRFRFRMD